MLTFKQAHILAETWVRVYCGEGIEILTDKIIKKPYGWIFFYQSSQYIESGDPLHKLCGNAPIIVDRFHGEIRITGTAYPLNKFLEEYEATLPKARLEAELPEEP